MFEGVGGHEVLQVWDKVEPNIRKALDVEDTGFSAEDILTCLQMRQMQLWVHPKAAAVTQIQVLPQYKKLVLITLGGEDMDEWLDDLMDTLEAYGRDMGCKYGEQWGRKGWLRVNEKRGYGARVAFYVMRKALR